MNDNKIDFLLKTSSKYLSRVTVELPGVELSTFFYYASSYSL